MKFYDTLTSSRASGDSIWCLRRRWPSVPNRNVSAAFCRTVLTGQHLRHQCCVVMDVSCTIVTSRSMKTAALWRFRPPSRFCYRLKSPVMPTVARSVTSPWRRLWCCRHAKGLICSHSFQTYSITNNPLINLSWMKHFSHSNFSSPHGSWHCIQNCGDAVTIAMSTKLITRHIFIFLLHISKMSNSHVDGALATSRSRLLYNVQVPWTTSPITEQKHQRSMLSVSKYARSFQFLELINLNKFR